MTLSNTSNLTATLTEEGYVEIRNGDFIKKISIKDYVSVLNTVIDQNDQVVANSTIRYPSSVHSVTKTSVGYVVNLYYEEREADLRHSNSGYRTVYMPNVMIRVELREVGGSPGSYSIQSVHWFATDKSRLALSTEWPSSGSTMDHIWTLPLPNIFGDARMCTGGNSLPSVVYLDWTILDMLYEDVLIRSPFNNDLTVPNLSNSMSAANWLNHLHRHYQREDTTRFPYEELYNY